MFNMLKVLALFSISLDLISAQVWRNYKLHQLLPLKSCKFLTQPLCWEHTQVLGVPSKVSFIGSVSCFFFLGKSSLNRYLSCSSSFQGNCLQNKDSKQRPATQCSMYIWQDFLYGVVVWVCMHAQNFQLPVNANWRKTIGSLELLTGIWPVLISWLPEHSSRH